MLERLFKTLAAKGIEKHLVESQKVLLTLADGGLILIDLEPRLTDLDESDQINIRARLRERQIVPALYGEAKDADRTRAISEYLLREALSVEKFLNVVSNVGSATKQIGDAQSRYMGRDGTLRVMVGDFWISGDLWAMTYGGNWNLATADLRPLAIWWRVMIQHSLNYMPKSIATNSRVLKLTNGLFAARDQLVKLARVRADLLIEEGKVR